MSSILNDTKHALGLLPDDDAFDITIINHINSVLSFLPDLNVGPVGGFMITGATETWDQLFADNRLNAVKSYLYLRVKLFFDPPKTGFEMAAQERQISEMEFRILSESDY